MDMSDLSVLCKGVIERIGMTINGGEKNVSVKVNGQKFEYDKELPTHTDAFNEVKYILCESEHKVIDSMKEIDAVGHRIVQGGDIYTHSVLVDETVVENLRKLSPLAPLHNNPEANAQAFTADGYFRTGDAGHFTPSGALVLTERVKDLFKTSNGKYIAPQMMESRLAENKYIDEVAVIGDQRKFVTALVVPNISQLRKWAQGKGLDEDTELLVKNPKVVEFIMSQIQEYQKDIADYEKIKRITLLPHHFSIMNGEVTNTMKVRRPIVARNYAAQIEAMYAY